VASDAVTEFRLQYLATLHFRRTLPDSGLHSFFRAFESFRTFPMSYWLAYRNRNRSNFPEIHVPSIGN
jgi:hypothetical protein